MKVVLIDAEVFHEILNRIEKIADKVSEMTRNTRPEHLTGWMDSADVCLALNITKKTLQRMRERDTLPYTRFNKKYYYKPEDIEAYINKNRQ